MFTTSQDIVNARQQINRERNAAGDLLNKARDAQLLALREQCAAIGHVYVISEVPFAYMLHSGRVCAFCGADEPKAVTNV